MNCFRKTAWYIVFIIMLMVAEAILIIAMPYRSTDMEISTKPTVVVYEGAKVSETAGVGRKTPIQETEEPEEPEIPEEPEKTVELVHVGTFKLTAYCACEQCCGQWANDRPVDQWGNPIVYTADGSVAKQGVTVAADIDVLLFGTVLLIDNHEYIVQDRGSAVNGNHIDIYFESHEEALQFGVQYKEIFIKEKNNEGNL